MRIIIVNSNSWHNLSNKIKNQNEILYIKKKDDLTFENIDRFSPELIFFPHWNWIVPNKIHTNFKCILFHTAPLPYGRGGSPIQNLIINGFKTSPVCALKMTSEMDAGPIYLKKILSLEGNLKEIFRNLNLLINEMIEQLIIKLPEPEYQKGEPMIFKRRTKKDNLLPKDLSITKVYDRIRMLDFESYPKSFIIHGNLKIEFYEPELKDGKVICKAKILSKNDF